MLYAPVCQIVFISSKCRLFAEVERFSRSTHRTATRRYHALAASSTVLAVIQGPSSLTSLPSDSGLCLFAILAEIRLFARSRATLEPMTPAPIMLTLIRFLLIMVPSCSDILPTNRSLSFCLMTAESISG
jgi:hypothetical protein